MVKVLGKLHEAGMHVNREKMQLGKEHVLFLGFDIHATQFILDTYVEAQRKRLPSVSSRGEIRKLLGIFNLCRQTCPGLARVLKPMQDELQAKN